MDSTQLIAIFGSILLQSAPLIIAVCGETISERAGVINLSLDGSLLLSALAGFVAALLSGSLLLGFVAAAAVGAMFALIVAFGSLHLRQNQVAIGFVLAMLGDSLSAFLGQSYSFNDTNNFDNSSGLDTHMSDIVGAVYLNPADYLDLMYRFRIDADSFQAQRDELLMQAGPDWLNVNVSYAFLSEEADPNSSFGDRQEIAVRLNTKIDEYWSAFVSARRDLEAGQMLSYGGGVAYADECFEIRTSVFQDNFEDDEQDPGIKAMFSVAFKNLGSFGSSP